jgi:succinyldiaminopimelate transaminase
VSAAPAAPPARPGLVGWVSLAQVPLGRLAPYGERARAHPGGIVDLSIGTPVDPTPPVVREALCAAADAPGYPLTVGTVALREALVDWVGRRLGATVTPAQVLPSIGSKELVALLPSLLGLEPGTEVLLPELAYPTYDAGVRLAGCVPVPTDDPTSRDPSRVGLVWLNSPSNPTGRVLAVAQLRDVVEWGRRHGVLVASDECYVELGWEAEPVSVLSPDVCGDDVDGVLALHSLSKRSNLAGYRAGFAAGDADAVAVLVEARKHLGLLTPAPVQAALVAALGDDAHVAEQKERYRRRREVLRPVVEAAGFRVDHSEAGLYLWLTRDEPCWETVAALAELGLLVAPGEFYGDAGARHVRMALTVSDALAATAAERLEALS